MPCLVPSSTCRSPGWLSVAQLKAEVYLHLPGAVGRLREASCDGEGLSGNLAQSSLAQVCSAFRTWRSKEKHSGCKWIWPFRAEVS